LACYQNSRRTTVVWRKINVVLITRTSNQWRWPMQLDFFSERVLGTTGFSLANIITPPHQYNISDVLFPASLIAHARAHVLRIRKNTLHLRHEYHDIFFPRNHKTWRLGKGKVNQLFMYFFSYCDSPASISLGFFSSTISSVLFHVRTITTITHDILWMVV